MGIDFSALLSPWTINIAAFVGVCFAAAFGYLKKLKDEVAPTPKPHDMVLTAGTIADMSPVREAVLELKGIRLAIETYLGMIRTRSEQEDQDERMEARMSHLMDQLAKKFEVPAKPAPRRRRQPKKVT